MHPGLNTGSDWLICDKIVVADYLRFISLRYARRLLLSSTVKPANLAALNFSSSVYLIILALLILAFLLASN